MVMQDPAGTPAHLLLGRAGMWSVTVAYGGRWRGCRHMCALCVGGRRSVKGGQCTPKDRQGPGYSRVCTHAPLHWAGLGKMLG